MMKSISMVANAVCVVLLCIPALAEKNDDTCCEGEAIDLSTRGILPDGLLELLKNALPDLHLTVTSAGWETTDGVEQLRTVVKPTLGAVGMKVEDVNDHLIRIDQYVSNVPIGSESMDDLNMTFGLVADAMLLHFANLEVMRDGADAFFEAYSIIHESHPEALAGYRECLDTSIAKMYTKTRLVFGEWMDQIEQEPKDSDILTTNVMAHNEIAQKLIAIAFGDKAPSDQSVCYAEHLEGANES